MSSKASLSNYFWRNAGKRISGTLVTLGARSAADSPLHEAAKRGELNLIESSVNDGVDLDFQNRRGETPLHYAVKHRHPLAAAALLRHGADASVADFRGRTPLSFDFTDIEMLHAIRQRYRRLHVYPNSRHAGGSSQRSAWMDELDHCGIVHLPEYLDADELAQLRRDFEKFVVTIDGKLARGEGEFRHYDQYDEEEHWWARDRAYVSNNAFKYSSLLTQLCCREEIVELANRYTGCVAQITRGVAMRYLPHTECENDMFGWHHDMEEKRLKVMILLTDIGAHDQYMSYVCGSHKLFHPYDMFLKNNCSLDYCREHLDEIDIRYTIGKAGDLFLFDSNGAHRGNRRPDAKMRDVFFVEYNAETSDVWGGDVDSDLVAAAALPLKNPFEQMLAVEKKWELPRTRTTTHWIGSLPNAEKWL